MHNIILQSVPELGKMFVHAFAGTSKERVKAPRGNSPRPSVFPHYFLLFCFCFLI